MIPFDALLKVFLTVGAGTMERMVALPIETLTRVARGTVTPARRRRIATARDALTKAISSLVRELAG